MRFLIIVQATSGGEARLEFQRQLAAAGVLLDAAELKPAAEGWRVRLQSGQRHTAESAAGAPAITAYLLIQVRSRDEALEWSRRLPLAEGDQIEVRPLHEFDSRA